MDKTNIHISKREEAVLGVMENAPSVTSEQLHTLLENEECLQLCCDIAETAIGIEMEINLLSIDTKQELADFHQKHIREEKKKGNIRMLWVGIAGAAATVVLFLALRVILFPSKTESECIRVFQADHVAQRITLQTSDKENVKPLKEAVQSFPSSFVQLSPQEINYNVVQTKRAKIRNKKVQIHKLSIPRGKVFKVVLSDGTEVLLNANTRLSYPTVFKGKERIVLLEGEAYFNVTKDVEHPFIVKSGGMQVRVLGTQFNVCGYSPKDTRVTLIEGKVAVSDTCGLHSVEINPGQSAQLASDGTFDVEEINTESLLYWKEGFFYFDDVTLADMMKEVGRWYNIDVVFRNSEIMNLRMHFLAKREHAISDLIELLNRMEKIHVFLENESLIVE